MSVSEECSILMAFKNCTTEEEQHVSTLVVNSIRNCLLASGHVKDADTIEHICSAVKEAIGNIKHGK